MRPQAARLIRLANRLSRSPAVHGAIAATPKAGISQPTQRTFRMVLGSRPFSTSRTNQMITKSSITPAEYHVLADQTMDSLLENLENIVENEPEANDWEVDYSSGVLTLKLGEHGTYVINKQPPNMQIWLSSPTSGPKRYDYADADGGVWFYARDGQSLQDLIESEVGAVLGKPIHLGRV